MKLIAWRIYYGDGTTFCDVDGPPESAPCINVMAIACYDDDNRRKLAHSTDYYFFENNRWYGCDLFGLFDYLARPGLKIVKFGRMIADEKYRKVMEFAVSDLPLEGAL